MRKIIAAINMTLDGFCDHTGMLPDAEIHHHYAALLDAADTILYGRKTYDLMKYWQPFLEHPSGDDDMDDFAAAIDKIHKIVFSQTVTDTGWETAEIAQDTLRECVQKLRQQSGKDILVGSRSLIIQLMNEDLIDELQLCIHPVIAGGGLPLFEDINQRMVLQHSKSKTFGGGAVIHFYQKPFTKGK